MKASKTFKIPTGVNWHEVFEALVREFRDEGIMRKRAIAATFALLTGRRAIELSRRRREHIDRHSNEITRYIAKKRGFPEGFPVRLPIGHGKFYRFLRRWYSRQGRPRSGRVLPGHIKARSNGFRMRSRQKGRKLRFHDLRHLFALEMVGRGVPLPVLRKMLQHADLKTTTIYVELYPKDLEEYML